MCSVPVLRMPGLHHQKRKIKSQETVFFGREYDTLEKE